MVFVSLVRRATPTSARSSLRLRFRLFLLPFRSRWLRNAFEIQLRFKGVCIRHAVFKRSQDFCHFLVARPKQTVVRSTVVRYRIRVENSVLVLATTIIVEGNAIQGGSISLQSCVMTLQIRIRNVTRLIPTVVDGAQE